MRRSGLTLAVLAAALVGAPAAAAHPLGNFTVNQYARIQVAPAGLSVFFVLDMAEIPTFQAAFDTDGNGVYSAAEATAAARRLAPQITPRLSLSVGGHPVRLVQGVTRASFPVGQAGLHTTRLEIAYATTGVQLGSSPVDVRYATRYAPDRIGWREIVVSRAPGSAVDATTAGTRDLTDALRSYPKSLLQSPLDVRSVELRARTGSGGIAVATIRTTGNVAPQKAGRSDSGFASLIGSSKPLTLGVVLVSLLLAMGFGMVHAMTPGHGKTMVAAYLVGTKGTARHAFALAATVTITHTAGVFALGFVTLSLSQFILPEKLYPWLNLVSGVMVLSIGLYAIRDRLRRWLGGPVKPSDLEPEHGHEDGPAVADAPAEHGHSHDEHGHSHGGHGHSHVLPDELSWRTLVTLGVSGGMIPCPSALVVLLSAVAVHRLAFGMVLIVAFSFGLAAVIAGIGLTVLYARRLFTRIPTSGRFVTALPIGSAIVITVLGVVLTARALPGLV